MFNTLSNTNVSTNTRCAPLPEGEALVCEGEESRCNFTQFSTDVGDVELSLSCVIAWEFVSSMYNTKHFTKTPCVSACEVGITLSE